MLNIVDHPDIIKIFKYCGFDYFIVDCEHGAFEYTQISTLIGLAKEMGIASIVRIPLTSRESILRYMEMGADGLMLPNTNTAELARELVLHAKYSPLGDRGISMMRGHNRYIPVASPLEYMKKANEETLLIVQIETVTGLKNVDEIAAVDGIDVALIGPNDLCHSLGIAGQQNNPLYIESVEKVIAAFKKQGKQAGTHGMTTDALKFWTDKGMTFILYSNEVSMLMKEAKSAVDALRN